MKIDRVYFMCPYLDGSPEGVVCNAVHDLIRNIQNIDFNICMGRHFEACHLYAATLKELAEVSLVQNDVRTERGV
jgi:hypothetical protein